MAVNRFLAWGLTASVVLNLLLAGIAGGLVWKMGAEPPPSFAETLSPESRKALFSVGMKSREAMAPLMKDVRGARTALADTLGAESFDPQAYDAAAQRLKDAQIRILDEKTRMMRETALSLPPEERSKLAERFAAGPGERGGFSENRRRGPGKRENPEGSTSPPPIPGGP